MLATLGLALLAGVLSTLSPCVLPLLPIVLGAAASQHRLGPLALATGLALSFVGIGLFLATIGFSLGIDGGIVRGLAALVMIGLGLILLVPQLQSQFAVAAGPIGTWAGDRLTSAGQDGLAGQFLAGLLLGAVWSPCVGPTLGAASVLAAQGQNLGQVTATMLMFGLGAALPLLLLGLLSREAMLRLRTRMLQTGTGLKLLLGAILVFVGLAVLTGADKAIEANLVAWSPAWLTWLTTRF